MSSGTTGSFGDRLREARERRGVTLRQIADSTKLSVAVLDALERNDFSRLPGGIFSRAFVRSFATEVGLDPEQMVREFLAQFPDGASVANHPEHRATERIEFDEPSGLGRLADLTRLNAGRLAFAAFALVVIVGLVIIASRESELSPVFSEAVPSTNTIDPQSNPAMPTSGLAAATNAPVSVIENASPAVAPASDSAGSRLQVSLTASALCWIMSTVDGGQSVERQLQPGEREVFDAEREVVLRIGDAGALAMTLNGASARPLGKPGEVVTVRLDAANFREYLAAQ